MTSILTNDPSFTQTLAWRSTTVTLRPKFTFHTVNASLFLELRDICPSIRTWAVSNHEEMTLSLLDTFSCTSFAVACLGKGCALQQISKNMKR